MGRLTESAVGAHLLNLTRGTNAGLYYWRTGSKEVDYVLVAGGQILAIEVKSGHRNMMPAGMNTFLRDFANAGTIRPMLVGSGGIPVESFLTMSMRDLLTWGLTIGLMI